MFILGALTFSLVSQAAGHGYITDPPSRTGATLEQSDACPYGCSLWFNQGCTIGCKKCGGVKTGFSPACSDSTQKATLPKDFETYNVDKPSCGYNPWCAPGSAGVMDPCGVAGGDKVQGSAGNGGDAPPGYSLGHKGSELPPLPGIKPRIWKVGEAVDVAWAIVANHGGGYQYRLCPKNSPQTEECFQTTPLEFVGDEQYIQYCPYQYNSEKPNPIPTYPAKGWNESTPANYPPEKIFNKMCDRTNRTAIPAKRLNVGTFPEGSTWTRNPIPACNAPAGGAFNWGCLVSSIPDKYPPVPASAYQFAPPGNDLSRPGLLLGGFGIGSCFGCNQHINPKDCNIFGKKYKNNCTVDETAAQIFQWSVVDKVRVPSVTPGDYVVSFRWDSEQTPQVWASCSDVTIVAAKDDVVV